MPKAGPDLILHLDGNFPHFVMLCHELCVRGIFVKNRLFSLEGCSYLFYCFWFFGFCFVLKKNKENDQKKTAVFLVRWLLPLWGYSELYCTRGLWVRTSTPAIEGITCLWPVGNHWRAVSWTGSPPTKLWTRTRVQGTYWGASREIGVKEQGEKKSQGRMCYGGHCFRQKSSTPQRPLRTISPKGTYTRLCPVPWFTSLLRVLILLYPCSLGNSRLHFPDFSPQLYWGIIDT